MLSVSTACALRWGVASIGITLLGVAHPIWDNIFKCGICAGGLSLPGVVRVKKADLWLCNHFLKRLD